MNSDQTYQPDFYQIAAKMVLMGAYVVPVPTGQKACTLTDWQNKATRDLLQVKAWSIENPHYNCAIVGKAEIGALWGFDDDSGILAEYELKHSPIKTYRTNTVSGGTHLLFRHNQKSIQMGNLSAKNEQQQELFSARTNNRYVISAGSVAHPHNDPSQPLAAYSALDMTQPSEAPDEFIAFLHEKASQTTAKTIEKLDESLVHEGGRNNMLTSVLGRARQVLGMNPEQLYEYGCSVNRDRCSPPLSDAELKSICKSVGSYEVKQAPPVILAGRVVGQTEDSQVAVPKLNKHPWPIFPSWIMHGTSIYEGFVKPVCEQNSRIQYFMFLPAAALMMNYLGTKIRVKDQNHIPSFFMVLIGEKGRAIKSSSVEDAIEYLHVAGVMDHAGSDTQNAQGKSLVWTAGSPEGLGLEITRTHCNNFVLYYDELSGLISKAEIDSSSLKSSLLTLYESSKFSNTIKSRKQNYNIPPRSYCASLIACTTDESFEDQWSRLTGKSTGLNDRFMFILQPEKLSDLKPKIDVNTVAGSMETRKRIDKAIQQQEYSIVDRIPLQRKIGELGNRTEIRAEKWALYFAVDLGLDEIDEGCIARGLAIAQYEKEVKEYLGSPEAETKIAAAQIKYRRMLERKFDGRAGVREMERAMNSQRYGTEGWYRIYNGLKQAGIIAEVKGKDYHDPAQVVIRVPLDE